MVAHRKHTATIKWNSPATQDVNGVFIPGSENTKQISCSIQPKRGRYASHAEGDFIDYNWQVFTDVITESIPEGAFIEFAVNGETKPFQIVQYFNYSNHAEIQC